MKKSLLLSILFLCILGVKSQTINFTITNVSPSYSITCSSPSVVLTATSNYSGGAVTYYWANNSSTVSGNSATLTTPGIYTIAAASLPNYGTQTISVFSNTTAPAFALTPTLANITCTGLATTFTLSASSPSTNIVNTFLSPSGASVTGNNQLAYYTPSSPGTYTAIVTNQANGCSANKLFTVTSTNAYPSYSVNSPSNFTLGCSTKSVSSIFLSNILSGSPGAPLTFTLIPPGASTLVSGPFGNATTYTVTTPGNYVVMVYEAGSGCTTKTPLSILQNTFAPSLDTLIIPTQTLNCANTSVTLQAGSLNQNVSYLWSWILNTSVVNLNFKKLIVNTNTAAVTTTVLNNYTLTLSDLSNLCKTQTIIPMYQNIFPPSAKIVSNGSFTRTCITSSMVLNNASSSGIPFNSSFSNTLPVIGFLWNGPSPQVPLSNSTSYTAQVTGVYTMTAKDQNNGCMADALFIGDDCLSLNPNELGNGFQFYPNPVKQNLHLVSPTPVQFKVTDIYGHLIFTGESDNTITTIDVSSYAKGIYLIMLFQNNERIKSYRLIKD